MIHIWFATHFIVLFICNVRMFSIHITHADYSLNWDEGKNMNKKRKITKIRFKEKECSTVIVIFVD